MPFNETQIFPDRSPDVQFFFHGLLMLLPDEDRSECQVGVHRRSPDHKLSISARVRNNMLNADLPDPPLLRLAGPLDSKGLTVRIDPPRGVSKFVADSAEFDRNNVENDERDFRWVVDLQTLDKEQPPMRLDKSGISPGITFKDGLFYAARLTNPENVTVKLTKKKIEDQQLKIEDQPLNRVARMVGADFYLEDGERLILEWFGEGKDETLILPKTNGERTTLINIDNSPPVMASDKPDHGEFEEYFKVITNATAATRKFEIDFELVGTNPHGTDRAPCMAVVVGG